MKKEYTRRELEHCIEFVLDNILNFEYPPSTLIGMWERTKKSSDDPTIWIDEWIALWPPKIKNSGGVRLRAERSTILPRMITFIKDTNFSKDLIFTATENYLSRTSKDGFAYTRASMYFINKRGEGSLLAQECEALQDTTGHEHYTGRRVTTPSAIEDEESYQGFI
jgi:hypothetical protein